MQTYLKDQILLGMRTGKHKRSLAPCVSTKAGMCISDSQSGPWTSIIPSPRTSWTCSPAQTSRIQCCGWGWPSVLTSLPGDSDTPPEARTTASENWHEMWRLQETGNSPCLSPRPGCPMRIPQQIRGYFSESPILGFANEIPQFRNI